MTKNQMYKKETKTKRPKGSESGQSSVMQDAVVKESADYRGKDL